MSHYSSLRSMNSINYPITRIESYRPNQIYEKQPVSYKINKNFGDYSGIKSLEILPIKINIK
ncbi:MAG: hypothetical protein QW041_02505 [Candidatus Pacearchaeota archaeon]